MRKKLTKAIQEQFERYKKAYGISTDEECWELYEYDTDHCGSDEDAQSWLKDSLTKEMIEEKELEDKFFKPAKENKGPSKAELKKNTVNAKNALEKRLDLIAAGLEQYEFLFGKLVDRNSNTLSYVDKETGLPISVKISKHKIQKVVTKNIKRKPVKLADGTSEEAPFTSVELRSMAIENVLIANGEDFEALSFAGTQVGFAARDIKYPFGSVKLTHHKA